MNVIIDALKTKKRKTQADSKVHKVSDPQDVCCCLG